MKISDLELYLLEVPRLRPLPPVRSLLVRLSSDSGRDGWGEASTAWRPEELAGRRDLLLPSLAGHSVFDIEELLSFDALAEAGLRAAVEMACWDLIGRAARQPLCHLFGGFFRQQIPLSARLPSEPLEIVPYWARELAEQGYRDLVVGSSGSIDEDLATLAAVREMTGQRCGLEFDAGGRYEVSEALSLGSRLDAGVRHLIDPLPGGQPHGLVHLQRQLGVGLAVCACIASPADVLTAAAAPAAAVLVDIGRVGGLLPARKCGAVAEAAGLPASLSSGPRLGIGMAAMLHVAASTPGFSSGNACGHHQLLDDILVEPLEPVAGMLAVPQGPGLGVEIDRTKVERYQVG